MRDVHRVGVVLLLALLGPGCNSETNGPLDLGVKDRPGAADAAGDAVDAPNVPDQGPAPDTTCTPTVTECAGLCGTLKDKCTGVELKCGGCAATLVCDLMTHTCVKPKVTCADLSAQCGVVRNSCGKHIDCGACPMGQECDPDGHACVPCKNPTCADLGYECGTAWLGCGPTTNTVACPACPTGKKCNPSYNTCEPTCTPQPAATICAAAKVAKGVECGYISDGCGGIVNCGSCPAGKGCGVYGVANRCDPYVPPDECLVLARNCGQIDSVCGGKLDCGTCPTGQVCNANGVCGPPCQPKTCADFAPKQCGAFPDGCNGTLSCTCTGGAICKTDGTCCTNSAVCPAGSCNLTIQNTCTGANIYCNSCTGTQYCDTAAKQCKPKKTCADYGPAGGSLEGNKCNDYPFYDQGNGTKFACPCTGPGGQTCINDSTTQEGTCCTNVNPTCPPVGQKGSCNSTVVNSCTGQTTVCTCPPGYHCEVDTCVANDTCATFGATGGAGAICSNGPSPSFPNGAGGFLTCPCQSGYACVDNKGVPVTGGDTGTCKKKTTCADFSATGKVGELCSNDPSSSFPDAAGGKLKCPCNSGLACADASDQIVSGDTTGTCKLKKTCGNYSATGAIGAPCNPQPFFDDGFGGKLTCPCTLSGGLGNNKCVGATSTQAGTCQCTKNTCTCANTGTTDGCGGTLSCPCPSGQSCNKTLGICCQVHTCAALPAGYPAGACGTITNTCLGTTFSCACDTTTKPNNKCVLAGAWGTCQCKPWVCGVDLSPGPHPNDGCGNPINCPV